MISTKKYMKIFIFTLSVLIAVIFLIWKFNDRSQDYEIESFVLINDVPYIVSDGTAYYWDDSNEVWIAYMKGIKELFRGEYFCVLKNDGRLELCTNDPLDIDSMPLGMQYTINQANKLLEISQNTPIRTLNSELLSANCYALCEDGSILMASGEEYIPFEIHNENIKDISGDFILTEEGNVYQMENEDFGQFSYKRVSEDKFKAIAAFESAPRCVGIRENNTVVMWSDLEPLSLTDWKNVKEIAVGFNYCIGLTINGEVLYADYDKEREKDISKLLRGIKAESITCCYESIAILKQDLIVEMIDLSECTNATTPHF